MLRHSHIFYARKSAITPCHICYVRLILQAILSVFSAKWRASRDFFAVRSQFSIVQKFVYVFEGLSSHIHQTYTYIQTGTFLFMLAIFYKIFVHWGKTNSMGSPFHAWFYKTLVWSVSCFLFPFFSANSFYFQFPFSLRFVYQFLFWILKIIWCCKCMKYLLWIIMVICYCQIYLPCRFMR